MIKKRFNIVPFLIYVITFYSSFRNAHVYIFDNPGSVIPVLLDYSHLLLNILLLLYFIMEKVINNNYYINKYSLVVLLLFIWVTVQSFLNSSFMGYNVIPRNLITSLLTILVLLFGIRDHKVFKNALWSFILGALVSAIIPLIIYSDIIGVRTTNYQGKDFIGGVWNKVLISFISCGWLILALIQKSTISKRMKVFGVVSFAIIWIGGFAGLSRSFFLATILSMLVYVISSKRFKTVINFILIVVIFVTVIETMFPSALFGVLERFFGTIDNVSEEARLDIWVTYLSNFSKYYLSGSFGNYLNHGPLSSGFGPHSVFLNWLVQYGILGLLGFLVFLSGVLKELFSIRKIVPKEFSMLLAWFSAYLIQITVSETGFVDVSFYVGLSFVLMWSKFVKVDKT